MGTCQSTGQNIVRSLEETCGSNGSAAARKRQQQKQKRKKRVKGNKFHCSSSSSSDNLSLETENQQSTNKNRLPVELELSADKSARTPNFSREPQELGAKSDAQKTGGHIEPAESQGKEPSAAGNPRGARAKEADQVRRESQQNNWDEAKLQKLKEGVDFIETEEDAKAVEAATLKIQSTFRGKKIRSKLGGGGASASASANKAADEQLQRREKDENGEAARELSNKVAEMQVKDKKHEQAAGPTAVSSTGGPPEEEAERAATKIQAGFKGYKTRKELEGKLPAAPTGGSNDHNEAPASSSIAR